MNIREGPFAGKLRELEKQHQKTMARLRLYQRADHRQVRQELDALWREEQESEQFLRTSADTCRSPAVTALSQAQLAYIQQTRSILREELPAYLHSGSPDTPQEQAEAAGLYAEYAMDFAAQAMRHALLAVLWAMDLQMSCDEQDAKALNHYEEGPR